MCYVRDRCHHESDLRVTTSDLTVTTRFPPRDGKTGSVERNLAKAVIAGRDIAGIATEIAIVTRTTSVVKTMTATTNVPGHDEMAENTWCMNESLRSDWKAVRRRPQRRMPERSSN